MSGPCVEFEERLRAADRLTGHQSLFAWVDGVADAEQCIGAGLRRTCRSVDWPLFERYVLVAHRRPSRAYTAALCDVLARHGDEVNNEDIVDVLAEIRDPAAVGFLADTLWWQPPWDEFHQLAVKCVWALVAIGTPEAFAVVCEAAVCEAEEIREAALRQLDVAGR